MGGVKPSCTCLLEGPPYTAAIGCQLHKAISTITCIRAHCICVKNRLDVAPRITV